MYDPGVSRWKSVKERIVYWPHFEIIENYRTYNIVTLMGKRYFLYAFFVLSQNSLSLIYSFVVYFMMLFQ
jgi:hypothetical protein